MILLVGFGGAAGAVCRYSLGRWLANRSQSSFPFATLLCNVSGSFLLGMLYALQLASSLPGWLWGLLGIGFCGAFTTMSTFGYETVTLLTQKKNGSAIGYVAGSVILGLAGAQLGMTAVHTASRAALLSAGLG